MLIPILFQVWAHVGCAFCRKFGLTGFFTIKDAFMVSATPMTLAESSQGTTLLGVCSIAGNIAVLLLNRLEYSRLTMHCLTTLLYGVLMIGLTMAEDRVSST